MTKHVCITTLTKELNHKHGNLQERVYNRDNVFVGIKADVRIDSLHSRNVFLKIGQYSTGWL